MKIIVFYLSLFFLQIQGFSQVDPFRFHGIGGDLNNFPVAVWLQDPVHAEAYKAGGINLFIGLHNGPTEEQLDLLRKAGMRVICEQNAVGIKNIDEAIIVGWSQNDEPDNAQADGKGGYNPCLDPGIVIERFKGMKIKDPSRPVYLNLGMGVSLIDWIGRGTCTSDTLSYLEYVKAGDIISFDIYPVSSSINKIKNNLWYVPLGIDNLRRWTGNSKPVWCWIETTHIGGKDKPSPYQVRTEVWMALIHGATGIGYFCHEWYPSFNPSALLDDEVMFQAVTKINREIRDLSPVLQSVNIPEFVTVESQNSAVPIHVMLKKYEDQMYLFAVSMRDEPTNASFTLNSLGNFEIEVLYESRKITPEGNLFHDSFKGYGVHLYKLISGLQLTIN